MEKTIYYASVTKAIEALEAIEKKEEGYLEKASNAKLDSKTDNAGYNNYTKYWRDLQSYGVMGEGSNFAGGSAWYWCAGFQSWCFIQAFGLDLAKKLLLHMPYVSCANLGDLAKKAGRLDATPQKGDIVLFYNGSRFSHTGFIYKISSTTFYTVEGNTNNSSTVVANGGAVCLKSYNISTYKNKGTKFYHPDYSIAVKEPNDATVAAAKTKVKVNTQSSALNCRAKANSNGNIVGSFAKGAKLTLIEKTSKEWWKVKGKDTKGETIKGYCYASYLKEV